MAADHEGWYLKANVDISSLLQANKATDELFKNIKKVDAGFSGLHGNDALAKSIKSADIETASYIDRLKSEGKTYEANEQKVNLYSNQITRLKNRQQGLVSELGKIAEKSGKNSDAFHIQKARINETTASINKLNDEVNKLHPTGFDRLTSSINKAERASGKIKDTLRSGWDNIKGGAYSAAAGIAAVGAAAVSGAKKAGNLQQTYKEIDNLAVLGGEHQRSVTKSIAEMQRQGRDMAIKYGKSQQEIAEGYEDLVKRGYSTKQALGALRTELQASVASGDKFSDVTTVSSQVIEAFGMRAKTTKGMIESTNKAVNMLAYSADATSTGFHSLGDSVHYFGAAAKAQNISLAESASAVGVLSNNGIEGSMGGTAMRDIIERIGSQVNGIGKKNSVFTKLGISTKEIEDSKGHLKSLADAMDVIWDHIKKHSQNSIQEQGFMKSIFGSTAQNAATILAQNTGELRKLTEETQKVGDKSTYVSKLAAKNSDTAKMQVARAKQAMNDFEINLGAKLLPAINDAGESLAKFLTSSDGKKFENDTANVIKNFANTLIGLARFVTQHPTAMKIIGGSFLAGYSATKISQTISFLGELKSNFKELAETSPKIANLGKATSQLTKPTKLSKMNGTAKLTTTVAVAFDAYQIGNDFYKAINSKSANVKYAKYGAGIGGLVGGAIGASLGGVAGAQIGMALGQAMGPAAAKSFGKAFSGHAAKYFVYGKKGAKSNGKYDSTAEEYNHDNRYLTSTHKIKGRTPLFEYDENGYYNTRTHKYRDQRSLSERSWGMNHRLNVQTLAHANNAWDVMSGSANVIWNSLGHIGDKDFWKRSKAGIVASEKGTWLDWSGFFNWVRKRKPGDNRNYNPMAGPAKGLASWWNKTTRNTKIDWGPFDPKKNGLDKWLAGFKPQVHGKLPKNWQLKASGILPKINAKKWASGIVKDAQNGLKGFPTYTRGLGEKSNKWFKSKWRGMESWGGKTKKDAQNGLHGFEKWSGQMSSRANKWFKIKWHGMQSWAGGINKNVRSGWQGFEKGFGDLAGRAVKFFKRPFEGLTSWFHDHVQKPLGSFGGNVDKFFHGKLKVGNLHLATGTNWKSKYGIPAVLNDGFDSPQTGNRESIIHRNGQIELLPNKRNLKRTLLPGEDVINAKDTARLANRLHFASGTVGLAKNTKAASGDYKKLTANATKSLTQLDKTSRTKWRGITSNTTKQSTKTRKGVVSDYTKMRGSVNKQMNNMHSGVIKTATSTSRGFGKAMDKMSGYAKDAMGDTIDQLNRGIHGIDKVIGEFGGDASEIKPVHFATGSNGALPHNTLAMVNDAKSGPRQEAIVRGNNLIIPSGKDRILPLQKGDQVLNGQQTQQMAKSMGLRHFAKGSGVGHAELKRLYGIAKQNWKQPERTGRAMFKPVTGLQAGAKVLADSANKTGADQGVKYWSALWGMAQKKVEDSGGDTGPASGLLKAVEKYGEGHKYVWGSTGPSTFDCSGLVMYALKHAYGIDFPHFSGAQYAQTQHISKSNARMGDLVFWGSGGSEHVGVYAGGNKYFSAQSPSQGIHMNTLASVVGKGAPLFGRVKGANTQGSESKSAKANVKANSALDRFVKNSVGPGFWKTMTKIGDEFGDGGSYGNPAGDGVARWRKYIQRAAAQMHTSVSGSEMSKILSMISAESSGNPTITQQIQDINSAKGTPAQGLLQFVPSTFSAFATKGHTRIKNGYDQLLALFNDSNWKSDIHYGGSWGPTGNRRFAKGGTHHGSGSFLVGEEGPELLNVPGDVKIDDHQTTRRKLRSLARDLTPSRVKGLPGGKPSITININFNGNVGNNKQDADRVANIVEEKIAAVLEKYFGHDFGTDPSLF
ncbi:phage tail tape measure protein [Lactobacillus crispatus]|uniref:phage tail tape measure protein n=1 Tax=Lactobacillus crispatus TaxID=47770 RepID=UPI001C4DF5A6|nr:phage tail tape measure protein [Lactobacillus crispatus]MBW0437279.1 phage tail tape measure protein [Lactobacillus crispatus]MBW0443674.1 phage tail tape measure protein [Lactobacillus crispatus]MBW0455876.1 phage tail tape measure protein [Lactobacillus crispatus]